MIHALHIYVYACGCVRAYYNIDITITHTLFYKKDM
jgi:hypothetical protein